MKGTSLRAIAAALTLIISAGAAEAATIEITIEKMAFAPGEITAKVGDTVLWVNKDAFVHTATAKGAWEIMLAPGKSGSVVISKAGTIDYICRLHPNMKGRITVTP